MPKYQHDCTDCTFIGTHQQKTDHHFPKPIDLDLYWCDNPRHPNLSSMIARFGDEGFEYISEHPFAAYSGGEEYLKVASSWYIKLYNEVVVRGLYKPQKTVCNSCLDCECEEE